VPEADRAAVTVEIELELDGLRVRAASFHRSTIRSDARLSYAQVDRVFAGAERAEEPWAAPLEAARRAAAALRARRNEIGASLEVESASRHSSSTRPATWSVWCTRSRPNRTGSSRS